MEKQGHSSEPPTVEDFFPGEPILSLQQMTGVDIESELQQREL